LEEHSTKLAALRLHLAEGAAQADRGAFIENFSVNQLLKELASEG
jgi:antitoxin ParD1/3/4